MVNRLCLWLCIICSVLVAAAPHPDSGDLPPLPGPGLSYGGIPYGSMSGNVAEYFRKAPSSGYGRQQSLNAVNVDFAPIASYL